VLRERARDALALRAAVPAGTFGVALLSRFPIRNARTLYLWSLGEQTAAIAAEIEAAGRVFNVFVTHLGNGGPREQLDDLLGAVVGRENAIVMGDFNFAPGTEQYGAATSALEDA